MDIANTTSAKATVCDRLSEEKCRLYFENTSDLIFSIDKDFHVHSVSPAARRALGYNDAEDFAGQHAFDVFRVLPACRETAAARLARLLAGKRGEPMTAAAGR